MKTFTDKCRELIHSLPDCTGDPARLAHRLPRACDKLELLTGLIEADKRNNPSNQFNQETIDLIKSEED